MDNICAVADCEGKVVSQKLCDKHRKRLKRHGHLKATRPTDWGELEKHPLYNTWKWMQRQKIKNEIDPSWIDFWKFVDDVGDRPSKLHRFMRKDKYIGYGPNNFFWKEITPNKTNALRAKEWREANPDKVKHTELMRRLGISLEEYNRMHKEQNGKCKICNKEESYEGYSLAVDHCHETGKIRGLLCSSCNKALGMFKDSITNLQKAINYLGA